MKHDDVPTIRQFLQFANHFVSNAGMARQPALVDRSDRPACLRADGLRAAGERSRRPDWAAKREILNDRFYAQYERLLTILSYRRHLDDAERMTVVYYLLLQDRVERGP